MSLPPPSFPAGPTPAQPTPLPLPPPPPPPPPPPGAGGAQLPAVAAPKQMWRRATVAMYFITTFSSLIVAVVLLMRRRVFQGARAGNRSVDDVRSLDDAVRAVTTGHTTILIITALVALCWFATSRKQPLAPAPLVIALGVFWALLEGLWRLFGAIPSDISASQVSGRLTTQVVGATVATIVAAIAAWLARRRTSVT